MVSEPVYKGIFMSLYKALSDYYDDVFAVSSTELDFVARLLPQNASLLDIGCGTGNKTVLFAPYTKNIVGIDPDANMIAKAHATHRGAHVEYRQGGMEDLKEMFAKESFSAITCLGNTLVHLSNEQSIQNVIKESYALLCEGGVFVAQILNYDYIMDKGITSLPVFEDEQVRFERTYDLDRIPIRFNTVILDKKQNRRVENSTPLIPLRRKTLEDFLYTAGFTDIQFYGSYGGDPLTDTSLPLIVSCRKK